MCHWWLPWAPQNALQESHLFLPMMMIMGEVENKPLPVVGTKLRSSRNEACVYYPIAP